MLLLKTILGYSSDSSFAEQLHQLQHKDAVEYLLLNPEDTRRRRIRLSTDKNTDCALALDRGDNLQDGAILKLDESSAIVVQVTVQNWMKLRISDPAVALQLGYFAGNLHWKVRFDETSLLVALEGPRADYLQRLEQFPAVKDVIVHDSMTTDDY